MSKYPKVTDNNFYNKINKIYKKYKIPSKKKSFNEICFPDAYELQIPQKFLPDFLSPNTPYKGMLVFYKIGSGKTCTAISIAEQWKHKRKIIVVVPASLKGNFKNELRSPCAGDEYLTKNERLKLNKLHPASKEYKEIIEISDNRIEKYYEIYSYNKFIEKAERNKIDLKKKCVIIDEIQNMVSEEGTYYRVLYNLLHKKAPDDLRVVLLSATPMFDKPTEIALTMNLLRLKKELPTGKDFIKAFMNVTKLEDGKLTYEVKNMDKFKELIKGYVSYFQGAPSYVFPEMTVKYIKCEMSDFQHKAYMTVLKKEGSSKIYKQFQRGEIAKLSNDFFIGTRIISNIVFPNANINEKGFESFAGRHITHNLETYSTKFHKIITKINRSSGKIFIYSSFKMYGGITSFVKVLEEYGFKDYAEHGDGKRRFAVWTGDENIKMKDEIRAVYNRKDNLEGHKLKIILGSPSIKEGVSLLAVRQVHILEPTWNMSKIMQIIGRASRYCSHKDLPKDERNVKVYMYIATHPKEKQTVDEYIARMAQQKDGIIQQFEKAMKESAIDCELFKEANQTGEKIVCEK